MKNDRATKKRYAVLDDLSEIGQSWVSDTFHHHGSGIVLRPLPLGRSIAKIRNAFDSALNLIHYAGACPRVGRCMRLLILEEGRWAGGIVLGSTFPNIGVRDEALGLKEYVRNHHLRGLRSPWASENKDYWSRLQKVVNHARTFVFPRFQGRGIGIEAHQRLLSEGRDYWESRYRDRVAAFDTLCDSVDSGLFEKNGWDHVGLTAGFRSDPQRALVQRDNESSTLVNNVALRQGSHRWQVWVKIIDPSLLS